jgi:hypothetical protein
MEEQGGFPPSPHNRHHVTTADPEILKESIHLPHLLSSSVNAPESPSCEQFTNI